MTSPFDAVANADVAALVEAYPLAWVVTQADRFQATPLPMLLECDAAGVPRSLLGHFGRSNPQLADLATDPAALFLFTGPHGYISPALAGRSDWGPTWNYAIVRIEAEIALDARLNHAAVARLIEAMERGRPEPWSAAQLGARYETLIARIIAFRAPITRIDARFKLGQDEADAVFANIVDGLGTDPLGEWMARFGQPGS